MFTNNSFIDMGNITINKHSETLCGDYFTVLKNNEKTVVVLSDGLGSGVKANILATLTATILGTMISKNIPLEECVDTVASTLPMCMERKLAYATFTVLSMENDDAYLVQYDNPSAIILRKGKNMHYATSVHFVGEKEIHESRIRLQQDDIIVILSDGVTNAGIGKLAANGWGRDDIVTFLERIYTPEISASAIAARIGESCMTLNLNYADDDTTAFVIKIKQRQPVNIMIGPPENKDEDSKILKLFFSKAGKRIICGGTTANAVSKYLNEKIIPINESGNEQIPAMAKMKGIDLITEGIITLRKAVEICKTCQQNPFILLDLKKQNDGASQLALMLIEEATDVNIYFGTAINSAHEGTEIDFEAKLNLIKQLEKHLMSMGKNVKMSLC